MAAIIGFVFFILGALLQLLVWAIIIGAVLSWLVAFDVINLRNRFVLSLTRFLDAITAPVLRPVQRVVPSLGGVDISPVIVILLIQGTLSYLLPALESFLLGFLA